MLWNERKCKYNLTFSHPNPAWQGLTHWGRVTHICVGKLTIIGSDNGLSPSGRQAIIWTNDGILLISPKGTNFSEILIGIQTFSFKKMHLKMSSAEWRPFCLGLNVLMTCTYTKEEITHSWRGRHQTLVFFGGLQQIDVNAFALCSL